MNLLINEVDSYKCMIIFFYELYNKIDIKLCKEYYIIKYHGFKPKEINSVGVE